MHLFFTIGRRYARWLPSFSVEVTHNLGGLASVRAPAQPTSQYGRMVNIAYVLKIYYSANHTNFIGGTSAGDVPVSAIGSDNGRFTRDEFG